jgi:hypothetical protein
MSPRVLTAGPLSIPRLHRGQPDQRLLRELEAEIGF